MPASDTCDCTENRIRRLHRVHAMLRGVNALIARARNRDELLMGACWIAVETGAFRMAWIGVIDSQTLDGSVVAWHGGEPGDIGNGVVTARKDTPASEEPACRALRQLRPVICNDIATESSLAPLREELLRSGHKSAAYFPFAPAGQPEAVIAVFADEVDFFEVEERELLLDMTSNMSFALDHMGNELPVSRRTLSRPADQKLDSRTPQGGATRYRRAVQHVRDHWTAGYFPGGPGCALLETVPA